MEQRVNGCTLEQAAEFDRRFKFDPKKTLLIGVEREFFLARNGRIVPESPKVLGRVQKPRFSFELSACQVEEKIGPNALNEVASALCADKEMEAVLADLGLNPRHQELAPADIPLDVYPDPTGRYQRIVKDMPEEILRAACRVAATHIHVGMPSREDAIRVHDAVIRECSTLCALGDHSNGERLRIYNVMARDWEPAPFGTWERYRETAFAKGFFTDPRQCWRLVRISAHGTVEFRMFGATEDLSEILGWVRLCHDLCRDAL